MMKKRRKLVEEFSKETAKHQIRLVAGIDPKPPDPYQNAIFYIRMESMEKGTEQRCKTEPIWLTLDEMMKLSMLMTLCSRFWENTLKKNARSSRQRIRSFIKSWNRIAESVDELQESI